MAIKLGRYALEIRPKSVPEYVNHWCDHLPNNSIPGLMVYVFLGARETSTIRDKMHNERYHSNSTEEPFVFRLKKA